MSNTVIANESSVLASTDTRAMNAQRMDANESSKVSSVLVDKEQSEQKTSEQTLDKSQLEKVAQQLQEFVSQMNKRVQFQVDEDSGRDVIKVVDKQSGDVLKQYPSEEVLALVARLNEAAGTLIDEQI